MEALTYVYEIVFLGIGIYMFLYSTGRIKAKDPARAAEIEKFRKSLNPWLTILSVVMIVLFALNLILHISQNLN